MPLSWSPSFRSPGSSTSSRSPFRTPGVRTCSSSGTAGDRTPRATGNEGGRARGDQDDRDTRDIMAKAHSPTWLTRWEPENEMFWGSEGKRIAWGTLTITTISLVLSFATWFMMSAIVVRLPQVGFRFDTMQLFWLPARPGPRGGSRLMIAAV